MELIQTPTSEIVFSLTKGDRDNLKMHSTDLNDELDIWAGIPDDFFDVKPLGLKRRKTFR